MSRSELAIGIASLLETIKADCARATCGLYDSGICDVTGLKCRKRGPEPPTYR